MKLDREDVERLLSECASEHKWPQPLAHELEELCRVWLAVDSAPEVTIEDNGQVPGTPGFDYGDMLAAVVKFAPGTRVRLVPLATAKGESNG